MFEEFFLEGCKRLKINLVVKKKVRGNRSDVGRRK